MEKSIIRRKHTNSDIRGAFLLRKIREFKMSKENKEQILILLFCLAVFAMSILAERL